MNHGRIRRAAGISITVLFVGLLTFAVAGPAQASHTSSALELTPEVATTTNGSAATITAKLVSPTTGADAPTAVPVQVDFKLSTTEFLTASDYTHPDTSCTIEAAKSSCSISLTRSATSLFIRGWVHEPTFSNVDIAEGRLSSMLRDCTTETNTSGAACAQGDETPGNDSERDQTDLVKMTWSAGATALDCSPETRGLAVGADTTVSCTVRDATGAALGAQRVDGENLNSANDPDASAGAGDADYDGEDGCVTGDDGRCTIEIAAAPAGGDRQNQAGIAQLCFWVDTDNDSQQPANDTFEPEGSAADGGGCDEESNDAAENANTTDRVTVTWGGTPTKLDVEPEARSGPVGTTHRFTATVTDQFTGEATAKTLVTFKFLTGSVHTGSEECTTPGEGGAHPGQCSVDITSATAGTDTICAYFGSTPVTTTNTSCNNETATGGSDTARIDVITATWTAATTTTTTTTTTTPGGGGNESAPQGYSLVGEDGSLYAFGTAKNFGDMRGKKLNAPIIGVAYTPGGNGYWLVAKDGGIFTFGDADFYGSMGAKPLNSPVIGMAATPTGKGYWLFAGDGGIFTFGDAEFFGSMGDKKLNSPVINMEPLESGNGYWLVAGDGGIFTFGQAEFFGSMGDQKLNQPVFDMTSTDTDKGYWLVARDGGVFSFGDAGPKFYGSAVNENPRPTRVIGMDSTPGSLGYWIADATGKIYPYGNAEHLGDRYLQSNPAPMIGFASVPDLKA